MASSTHIVDNTKNCHHLNKIVKNKYLFLHGFNKCIVCDKRWCRAKCSDCGQSIHPRCSESIEDESERCLSEVIVAEDGLVPSRVFDRFNDRGVYSPSTPYFKRCELIKIKDPLQEDEKPRNIKKITEATQTVDSGNSSLYLEKSLTGSYAVYIPDVIENELTTVIKAIESYIEPAKLYLYSEEFIDNTLVLTTDNYETANLLKNISEKITLNDGRKLIIEVGNVSSKLYKKISEAVAMRYDPNMKHLDLSNFHSCQIFTEGELLVYLNRSSVLKDTLNIAAKYDIDVLSLTNNQIKLDEEIVWISKLFPQLKVLNISGNNIACLKMHTKDSGIITINANPAYKHYLKRLFPMIKTIELGEQHDGAGL